MTGWIVALVLSLSASAFLTAAEVALFALGDARVRSLVDNGESALARIRSRPRALLVLLRFSDGLVALIAGAASFRIGLVLGGLWAAIAALAATAFVLVVVGEIWPRRILGERGVRFAVAVAPWMLNLSRLLRPILYPLERLTASLPEPRLTAVSEITETEIRQLAALGQSEGSIDEHEGQIIERAFRLDETRVWDIMTPRVDIFAWPDSLRLEEIASQFGSVPWSRVPVYDGTIDDVTGLLYLRDAYQALIAGQRDVPLRQLARQPLVVPGSLPLTRLLRDFQNRRIHLALVVDEYGGIDGLVTLEDVIEELVGEIEDEMDVTEVSIVRISRSEIVAEGDTEIREINHIFNTALPMLKHRSLNGYLMEELGSVPAPGQTLERQGLEIEVLDASETQVLRARITRLAPITETGEPARQEPSATAGAEVEETEVARSEATETEVEETGAEGTVPEVEPEAAEQPGPRRDGGLRQSGGAG